MNELRVDSRAALATTIANIEDEELAAVRRQAAGQVRLDVEVGLGAALVLRSVAASLVLPGPHGTPDCTEVTARVAGTRPSSGFWDGSSPRTAATTTPSPASR